MRIAAPCLVPHDFAAGIAVRSWALRIAIVATLSALQVPAHAADRYWDANRTDVGLGGSGDWDPTSSFWDTGGDGVSGPYVLWDNAALDRAIFTGTAGTVTLTAPMTVAGLDFLVHNYTLSGSTLTLAGVNPIINNPGNTTIDSVLAGTGGLTKTGAGGLYLNGANTFSGDINLNLGSIYAADDAALGAASNNVTTAAGALVRLAIGGTVDTHRAVTIGSGGTLILQGTRAGSALVSGDGNVSVAVGTTMSNDASSYTGTTTFSACNGFCSTAFTSIADLGMPSSLGAPSTAANGLIRFNQQSQYSDSLIYLGSGNSSNRDWLITGNGAHIHNQGSGTLTLTGNLTINTGAGGGTTFHADYADFSLLGQIDGNANLVLNGSTGRTVTLGGANSYIGDTGVVTVTAVVPVLADSGNNSSFGTGSSIVMTAGTVSYTGAGASSDRAWSSQGANSLRNDGTGALALSGPLSFVAGGAADSFSLGGSYAGMNTFSGVISGVGDLVVNSAGTWSLDGVNTRSGRITVQNGTLRADNAQAFGTTTGVTIDGGTLDLNGFDFEAQSLAGSGGTLALGGATLTLNAASGNTNYAGNITDGNLTKLGVSTQTLSGTNTYTGATTIGGGTLGLNFAAAGGPTSDIISSLSTLNLSGGSLVMTGAAGENNTQTFNGVNIIGGTGNISVISGAGGSATLNLGAINRSGGLIDFDLPGNGFITTSNLTLGGWATVNNGANYAKVVGGNITALAPEDYVVQNDPSLWQDDQIITDSTGFTANAVDSPDGTLQLGGLRYTAAKATTLNIASGDTLGVDGNILVAPSVAGFNQLITGGSLTGPLGGGMLGIQQNSTGTFTIASQIVNNSGSATGFTKAGSGRLVLSNTANTYTGPTVISQGMLSVGTIANGGVASSIGASSADPSNLVIEGGTLDYTGTSATTNRGFTLVRGGPSASTINVANGAANLAFTGRVTSSDDADFTKTGAGTLTLANAANDYSGVTTVAGGVLSVGTLANGGVVSGIGRSSSSSSNLVLRNGTLQYTGGTVVTDRGFTLDSGNDSIDVAQAATTLTFSGTAVGTGRLIKEGAGTLVLSGTNAYTGGTIVNAGTLRAGSAFAFGPATNYMTVLSGATLELGGFDIGVGALIGNGTVDLGANTLTSAQGPGVFNGKLTGSGGFTRGAGSYTQVLSGCNNDYTGATTINSSLSVDCIADGGIASSIGASTSDASNLAFNNGTLTYTGGSVATDRGFTLASGNGVINVSEAATTLEFEGLVAGGGTLVKSGAGTLVLSGNNTYSGITFANGGILRAGSNTAFGTGGIRMDVAGATLDLAGFDTTVAYLHEQASVAGDTTRTVALGGATLTIAGNGGFFSGTIVGNGNLIKNTSGTQTLTGCNNSYTGSTSIINSALAVVCLDDGGSNSSIGNSSAAAGNLYINGGALSYVGAGSSTDRQFTMGASGATLTASGTGAVNFTNTAAITLEGTTARTLTLRGTSSDNNSLAAQIVDSSVGLTRLTKLDAGTWVLLNPNSTYTGVTSISGGVLAVNKLTDGLQASSIGASSSAASNLVIGNGSTLRYVGSGDTSDRLFTLAPGVTFIESSGSGAINFNNTAAVTLSGANAARTIALGGTNTGSNTLGGTIGDSGVGKTTLAKNDGGTWVLTGDNTYTGNTVINDGNLVIGNGGTTGNAGAGNVIVDAATSTLSINRSDTFDFNGTLSGPGALAQIGTGTTRLTAAGSSIGATTVSAGTLQVAAGADLTSATVATNGSSTLNVAGTLQGSSGAAAVFTGDAGASTINIEAGGTLLASGDLGAGSDSVNVTGALNTSTGTLSLGAGDDTFTLNDGAIVTGGGIDAGSASTADTLQVNNATGLAFNAVGFSGFERLVKQNTGLLALAGAQAYSAGTEIMAGTLDIDGTLDTGSVSMADGTTLNVDGTVQAADAAPTAISGSAGINTVLVNVGATLNANGDLGDGSDVVTVAGTLATGASALSLGAGDDTFTLSDGAVISGAGLDGGAATTADVLVLDNAAALTFDGGMTAGFEQLIKQNAGTATMTGSQTFADTTIQGGTLDVDGTLAVDTLGLVDGTALNVDGAVRGAGATQAVMTGSTGVNTVTVGAGGSLLAAGDLGDGADVVALSGILDTGAGSLFLGDGDDTLTLNDGAVIGGTGVDAAAGANDRLVLNNASALTFNGDTTAGFEALVKQNAGVATMTGTQGFSVGTSVDGGTLDIDGTLETPNIALADGTILNVDGTVQATGGTQTVLTGSAGVNTVSVSSGATLLTSGDLGGGNDVLDIEGTLDVGAGVFSLGDGDDVFVVHDGTNVIGTVDGGAGLDTRAYDINLTADVGALLGFEGLTKTGTGTLNVKGPGTTSLQEVEVLGGTLNVAAGGAIANVQSTTVGSGATLNVEGTYAGSTGNDTFTVAGTVGGAGSIDLGIGDDVLTLQDGAALNIAIDAGGETAGDRVVLDNASALTFDGTNVAGFEELVKQNTGTATLASTHTYDSVAIDGGILDVDGTLQSAAIALADGTTLTVDGTVQAAGGAQSAITGTAGVNTVVVNAGGTLLAAGDLGDGNDVLDVAGTLNTGGGVFSLGAGDDTFVVHNTTQVIGTLDGGAGNDLLNVNVDAGSLVPLGSTTGFESLGKSGLGTLQINGASDFIDVRVQAGLLDIDASGSITAQTVDVSSGATLNVDGALNFTSGADDFTVAGTVSGAGVIDMLDGDDTLTVLDGADLSGLATAIDGGTGNDTLAANIATSATLGGATGFETLSKEGVGTLHIAGPASSSFDAVDVLGGSLDVAAGASVTGVTATTVASGATLNVDGNYAGSAGNDTFTLAGAVSGAGTIDLGAGDDVLTIRDGATLGLAIDGGGETAGDRVVLDNAAAFTLDGADISGFEQLAKQNTGTATLIGTQAYDSVAVDGGTLDVDGTLETATANLADGTTLNVDGTMQEAGGTQSVITGSSGVNTVVVSTGAILAAAGDLGDGSDMLDVGGTLDVGGGAFSLGAGDDTFMIRDGTNVIGTVVGGGGFDTRIYDITGTANVGALQEFEGLTKRNTGTLNINGPGVTTDLLDVAVEGGVLNVAAAGSIVGVQTTTVSSGATLNVDGAYTGSAGSDTFTVAGTVSGAGSIDLGDGDDVLTLQDGAVLSSVIDGGNAVGGDRVVLDNASDFTFDGANVSGFEDLVKQNTGTATLAGSHSYGSTAIDGGTLDVNGTLETATVALADGATLNIDGTVQAAGAAQTAITGDAGVNSIVMGAGSTLLATGDLGDGNDVFDVAGTFDTGGGTFYLGAGDDTFVVHDNTVVNGVIDGGAGLDTRVYDINLTADLGALTNFEGLTKTGTGVLNIHGPGSSDLQEVEVLGGTLNIASTGGIVGVTSATVGAGTTLNVDGVFEFTAGADTLSVAGTVTGLSSIDMLDGDDQLTLSDGADLSALASPLDGGAGNDVLIADIATTATLGGVTGFENLTKQGAGSLNVAAPAVTTFDTVLVQDGVLDVAAGATVEAHTASVEQGATLNADGDFLFTAGGDTLTVAGIVTGLGSIDMLDGDDQLMLLDGADLSGLATSLDGGAGTDTLTANITTKATLGGASGFETLIKEGVGEITIAGPAGSMFDTVLVRAGELNVAAGAVVDPQTTVVDAGATMTVDGTYNGTADADTFTLSGMLAGSGNVDLLDGDDVLTINTGADVTYTGVFDANTQATADRFVLAGAGDDTLDSGLIGTVFQNFEEFSKEGTGTWRLTGTGSNDWKIAEGTLIGDSQSFGGNLDNAATVVFDQATDGSYDHVVSGDGTLIKRNAGTLALSATHTFTGETQIAAGTLQVDGVLPGTMTVNAGATLSGIGTVGATTALAGSFLAPGTAALPFGTLTIDGNYTGGGSVRINTVLGNEQSDTSRLLVKGNTSGTSAVLVNRWSGNGAQTQGDGIRIIQVDGESAPDSFQLGQKVEAGAYEYLLHQGGSSDANDWYLRSELIDPNNPGGEEPPTPAFRAGVPGYVLGHQTNLEYGFAALGNLRARVGDQNRVRGTEQHQMTEAWIRVQAQELDIAGKRFMADDLQLSTLQFGKDLYSQSWGAPGAGTHFGVMASFGESRATLRDKARSIAGLSTLAGDIDSNMKGGGFYWTGFGKDGGYFDLSTQILHYHNRYNDQSISRVDQRGWGGTLSAEIGTVRVLGTSGWMVEPQAQLVYQRLELDAFRDRVSEVEEVKDDALRARASVLLLRTPANWLGMTNASPYVGLGVQHDFRDAPAVVVGGTEVNDEIPGTTGDVSVGFTGSAVEGVELHLDLRYQKSTERERDGAMANFGFRISF